MQFVEAARRERFEQIEVPSVACCEWIGRSMDDAPSHTLVSVCYLRCSRDDLVRPQNIQSSASLNNMTELRCIVVPKHE